MALARRAAAFACDPLHDRPRVGLASAMDDAGAFTGFTAGHTRHVTQLSPLASQHHLSEYSRIKHGHLGRLSLTHSMPALI